MYEAVHCKSVPTGFKVDGSIDWAIRLVNFCFMSQPPGIDSSTLSEEDTKGIEQFAEFKAFGSAYAVAQATRPATVGIVLSSSPIALLAW